jgi:hypothetical protein
MGMKIIRLAMRIKVGSRGYFKDFGVVTFLAICGEFNNFAK